MHMDKFYVSLKYWDVKKYLDKEFMDFQGAKLLLVAKSVHF